MVSKISLILIILIAKKPIPIANYKCSIEFEDKGDSDLKVHLDYSYHQARSCEKFEKKKILAKQNCSTD